MLRGHGVLLRRQPAHHPHPHLRRPGRALARSRSTGWRSASTCARASTSRTCSTRSTSCKARGHARGGALPGGERRGAGAPLSRDPPAPSPGRRRATSSRPSAPSARRMAAPARGRRPHRRHLRPDRAPAQGPARSSCTWPRRRARAWPPRWSPSASSTASRSTPTSSSTCASCPIRTSSTALRPLDGRDERVRDFVLEHEESQELLRRLEDLLEFVLPVLQREGKAYLTVAIGCTGRPPPLGGLVEELRRFLDGARLRAHRRPPGPGARVSRRAHDRAGALLRRPQPPAGRQLRRRRGRGRPRMRTARSWSACDARPEVRLTVHCTGSLLEWLRERAPRTFDLLGAVARAGQVELLTGGFYEPILAVLPDARQDRADRAAHRVPEDAVRRAAARHVAGRARVGAAPAAGAARGRRRVRARRRHATSRSPGSIPRQLGGYYLTEEQGATLGVFPISQRLRYLIPFAEPTRRVEYLRSRRGPRGRASPWSTTARSSAPGRAPTPTSTVRAGSIASSTTCSRNPGSS